LKRDGSYYAFRDIPIGASLVLPHIYDLGKKLDSLHCVWQFIFCYQYGLAEFKIVSSAGDTKFQRLI